MVDLNCTFAELSSEYDVISTSTARTETIEHFLLNQEICDGANRSLSVRPPAGPLTDISSGNSRERLRRQFGAAAAGNGGHANRRLPAGR